MNKENTVQGRSTRKRILLYMLQYYDAHQFMPSLREIAIHCSLTERPMSSSTVVYHLEKLTAAGLLSRESRIARGVAWGQPIADVRKAAEAL
jgi:hypothetical protein